MRTLLSTYEVTSLAGDGSAGTLGAAIAQANAATDGDQYITFDSSLTATGPATIPLNGSALELNGSSGTIKIIGPTGDDGIIIDAQQTSGVFQMDGGSVELDNLTITGGSANTGAGVLNNGYLTLDNCTITNNTAAYDGGGVCNSGAINLSNSAITANTAGQGGGGIMSAGLCTIVESTLNDNSAAQSGGGLFSKDYSDIINSTVTGNSAPVGGGLYFSGASDVDGCTINNNSATTIGGGINADGRISIRDSTISNNSASQGGGLYGSGDPVLIDSTVALNTAVTGAGIDAPGGLSLTFSTIALNSAGGSGSGGIDANQVDALSSIIAGNTPVDFANVSSAAGTDNLIGDGSGGFTDASNIQPAFGSTPVNAELAPLALYGGPTQTMPPLPGSPAIGAAGVYDDGFGSSSLPSTDQRGQQPANGFALDIGAVQDVPIVVSTFDDDPILPGQLNDQNAMNLAAAWGGNPSIGYAYSDYTDVSYDQGFWITWPTSVSENSDATITLSYGVNQYVQDAYVTWNGNQQTVPGSGNSGDITVSSSFSAAGQQQLTASISFLCGPTDHWIDLPDINIAVVPNSPTGLATTVASATEIDLSWTDQSSVASDDVIYESEDDGTTFFPIDEVLTTSAGSTNSYQATGLTNGSEYLFYVTAQADVSESLSSGLAVATTTYVAPAIDVEGTGTVVEGQPYEIDVTADYPDGEPGVVNHFHVDWSDGTTGNYSYAPGEDVTQPLVITHTFISGYASPNVTVTAVDSVNGSWTADPQSVAVTPVAPTLSSVTASANSITAHWSNTSSISTGTTVLLSTDGTNYFEYGDAAAGATSLTIANLSLDTHYWVETLTDSVNGISPASSSLTASTPYVAPTLNVSAPNPAIAGEPYVLNLSATYADGTPLADQVDHWLVNYGDGNGTQTYSTGAIQSPTTNSAGGTHTITVIAVDGNGNQISYPSQTVTYSTPDGNQDVTTQGPNTIIIASGVDVGGEEWLAVTDSGGAGLSLSYRSTDSDVMAVMDSRADSGNNYEVLVKGVSFGQANIVATDNAGSIGQTGTFWDQPLSVTTSNSTSSEIEGGNYNSSNMPGFYFSTVYPSVTAINVQFNTDGSTLPSSLLGWLNSGSMTIPAGITRQFEAFTVDNDGNMAPTRDAEVNIDMTGDTEEASGLTADMDVTDPNEPTITMNGQADQAVIPVDPQGDNTKLTDIHMSTSKVDGTIQSWTLIWNPGSFTMWQTKKIGTLGTDLGSIDYNSSTGTGSRVNETSGLIGYTKLGSPPSDIFGQSLSGSRDWDTTSVTLVVTVSKPHTQPQDLQNSANGTANGPEIIYNGGAVTDRLAATIALGEGVSVSAIWEGPSNAPDATSDVNFKISHQAVSSYSLTLTSGDPEYLARTVSVESPAGIAPSLHFYWVDPSAILVSSRTVSVSGTIGGMSVNLKTTFAVWTPKSDFTVTPGSNPLLDFGSDGFPGGAGQYRFHFGKFTSPGANFLGHVTSPPFVGGKLSDLQLVKDDMKARSPSSQKERSIPSYVLDDGGVSVSWWAVEAPPAVPTALSDDDSPFFDPLFYVSDANYAYRRFAAKMYLMWQADSTDSVPVALQMVSWGFSGCVTFNSNNPASYHVTSGKPDFSAASVPLLLPSWGDYWTDDDSFPWK